MRDRDGRVVAVPDREGRARNRPDDAERPARSADECRLARAELAGDRDDVAGPQKRRPGETQRASVSSAEAVVDATSTIARRRLVSRTARAGPARAGSAGSWRRRRRRAPRARIDVPEQRREAAEIGREHLEHPRRVERGSRMEERIEHDAQAAERDLLLLPWTRVIPSGLPERSFVAKLPSVATTCGWISSIWRKRWLSQASISSGCGSRFPGGRHLSTFAM